MLRPRVIPILLLKNGGLVKGIRFKNHKYVGDPMNAVKIFNEKKADEILFIDISATARGQTTAPEFVQQVADEAYVPFGVGGGIRTVEDIGRLIRAGAEKVTINTAAVENPSLIREASGIFGRQSIVVSIDVGRDWRGKRVVYTHCGGRKTDLNPIDWAKTVEDFGAGEILLTSIERDGSGRGYDISLVKAVGEAVSIPLIACGGAGEYDDLRKVIEEGQASAAAAGSLFTFYGPHRAVLINYPSRTDKQWWTPRDRD